MRAARERLKVLTWRVQRKVKVQTRKAHTLKARAYDGGAEKAFFNFIRYIKSGSQPHAARIKHPPLAVFVLRVDMCVAHINI